MINIYDIEYITILKSYLRERKNSNVSSFSFQNNNKKRTKKHFNSRSDEKARDIEK